MNGKMNLKSFEIIFPGKVKVKPLLYIFTENQGEKKQNTLAYVYYY